MPSRALRIPIAAFVAVSALAYLILVVCDRIPKDNRLGLVDVGIIAIVGILVAILVNPEVLDRLSLIKLPGGIEMTLRELERKQDKQRSELNDVRFMLTYLLSVAEHAHLHALALSKADDYLLIQPLREELRKLRRLGLIEEVPGRTLNGIKDGTRTDLKEYLRLTPRGREYLIGLAQAAESTAP